MPFFLKSRIFKVLLALTGLGILLFAPHELVRSWFWTDASAAPNGAIALQYDGKSLSAADLLNRISEEKSLSLQRGIGTVPTISTSSAQEKVQRFLPFTIPSALRFSLNFPNLIKKETNHFNCFDFGGIILYTSNLGNVNSLPEYRDLVHALKEKFTFSVNVVANRKDGGARKLFRVEIAPFIVADSDLSYNPMRYCRGPVQQGLRLRPANREECRNNIRKIISDYRYVGLDSTLSPDVDVSPTCGVDVAVDLARFCSTQANQAGIVPVLKHFVYNRSLGDSHRESFYNPVTDDQFHQMLGPYFEVERLGIPYMIMLSHHRLPLDPRNPLPRSKAVNDFVKANFPHCLTMSDEIKMSGLSKHENLYEVTRALQTDLFLFHSGNLLFAVSDIIKAVRDGYDQESKESVKKILMLKYKMGLVKITEMNPRNHSGAGAL